MSSLRSVLGPAENSWHELWRRTADRLERAGVTSASNEARWIVQEASGLDVFAIEAIGECPTDRGRSRVDEMVARRLAGEPLQYVLGSWSFCGRDLLVDHRVLIPRPETEITAQVAIAEAVRLGARRGRPRLLCDAVPDCTLADLGTGSGAIAVALAAALVEAEVWATDRSEDALDVARANLAGAGSIAARIRVARGDWFGALHPDLRGRLSVVVTNPPYVAEPELADLAPEVVQHEPRDALVAGPTGFETIERLVPEAPVWLRPGGAFVCELAPHQAEPAVALASAVGFARVRVEPDLTGRDRVLVATT
jgi:release factor glutamine methyltransferase